MKKMTKTKGIVYFAISVIVIVLLGLLVGLGLPDGAGSVYGRRADRQQTLIWDWISKVV